MESSKQRTAARRSPTAIKVDLAKGLLFFIINELAEGQHNDKLLNISHILRKNALTNDPYVMFNLNGVPGSKNATMLFEYIHTKVAQAHTHTHDGDISIPFGHKYMDLLLMACVDLDYTQNNIESVSIHGTPLKELIRDAKIKMESALTEELDKLKDEYEGHNAKLQHFVDEKNALLAKIRERIPHVREAVKNINNFIVKNNIKGEPLYI